MASNVFRKRLSALRRAMPCAMLLTGAGDVAYYTGWHSYERSNEMLLVTGREALLFSWDPQIARSRGYAPQKESGMSAVRKALEAKRAKKIGLRPAELAYSSRKRLGGIRVVDASEILDSVRIGKEKAEIASIRKACAYADRAMMKARDSIHEGATERQIRASLLGSVIGESDLAFDPIVASGANSLFTHVTPSDKKVRKAETVIVDIGFRDGGYCSDLTRTFAIAPTRKQEALYETVVEAQQSAIDACFPGMKASELAGAVKSFFDKKGLLGYWKYSLGHGVGLDVHEAPSISVKSRNVVPLNATFTLEPGLHVPGIGGVRIEDVFVMTKSGAKQLTKSPKAFEL